MNYFITIFQGFFNSLETSVSRKLMAASTFFYYSAENKKIKRITWMLLALVQYCSNSKHFNITGSVS